MYLFICQCNHALEVLIALRSSLNDSSNVSKSKFVAVFSVFSVADLILESSPSALVIVSLYSLAHSFKGTTLDLLVFILQLNLRGHSARLFKRCQFLTTRSTSLIVAIYLNLSRLKSTSHVRLRLLLNQRLSGNALLTSSFRCVMDIMSPMSLIDSKDSLNVSNTPNACIKAFHP